MTNKAYIAVNKEQELYVLNKFEAKGLVWFSGDEHTIEVVGNIHEDEGLLH